MQFPPRNITGLPEPDKASRDHSDHVAALIRKEIAAADGVLPFSRFMELALYAPGLGYYVAGQQRFGSSGDFVTAPGLGNIFGQCLANQVEQVLGYLDTPGDVLEFGAGSGQLAATVLNELDALGCLPQHYYIVEPSPDLRKHQQDTLTQLAPELVGRVDWITSLPDKSFSGVIIANEVLDAMPVNLFGYDEEGVVQEFCVSDSSDGLVWSTRHADENLEKFVQGLELDPGYVSERNVALNGWIAMLSGWFKQGVALLVDYGFPRHEYYHPDRREGTLMCHYRHHNHGDPLRLTGIQDITAHVDFTAVAEAADDAGLDVLGFTNQAGFLIGNELPQRMAQLMSEDAATQARLNHEIQMLTSPAEMGELFKVMALGKDYGGELDGFVFRDMRGRL